LRILEEHHIDPSDRDIFIDYFRILDTRNRSIVHLQHLLIALSPFVSSSISSMFDFCFQVLDRKEKFLVDKVDVVLMLKLINQTCFYIGDKVLAHELVNDLVDSVYTSAGKIDGEIFYKDYIEYMTLHPVIQLFISLQFQGPITAKILTDEQIEASVAQEQE
jgi:Ca2+-binding EF-hand superfamily protein